MRQQALARLDLVIATAVVVVGEVELVTDRIVPWAVAVPMAALAGGCLALRRRWPLIVVVVCFGALVVDTWAGVPLSQPVTPIAWILICLYGVARQCDIKRAVVGLLIGFAFFASTLPKDSSDLGFGLVLIAAPWLVGLAMRSRVAETESLADHARALERQREEDVRAAAAAERTRIARDLHDVIAHSVSVMVVQAAGAAQVLEQDHIRAASALQTVQDTGRAALTEISALLGILRQQGEEIGMAPHPGLAELVGLLEETRASGLPVELHVEGDRRELPAGVELSIYRVVQEALTNTRKHAGPTQAVVTLCYTPAEVRLDIHDAGAGHRDATTDYGGRQGLVGMRERVAVYGGTLSAGPQPSGGYAVHACIPVGTP